MNEDKLISEILKEISVENEKKYLDCVQAFEISAKLNVAVADVGKACNRLKIKIRHCQLGCF
jgi:hypothetical protein